MNNRLPNVLTVVTAEQMFQALGSAWTGLFDPPPTANQILLLVSQSAFETGWWKYMHCFNIGNVKSRAGDGCDYTYFKCWEMYSPAQAEVAQKAYPDLVTVEETLSPDGKAKVWFLPDHPTCRFRAYETLELAAADFLKKLNERFSDPAPERDAWAAVLREDPVAFCHALKLKGYYTGPEEGYTRQVKGIFDMLKKRTFDVSAFSSPPEPIVLTDQDLSNARQIATLEHLGEEDDK